MLTEQEKENLKHQWLTQAAYWGQPPQTIYSPKIGQVYAFEMQDSTVKIGVTQDAQRRIGEVENVRCLDVLRVHATDFAPYDFMTKLEVICHKAFEERRVRGEYFDITFEEAVAELDSHAQEIAAAHNKADQRLLDEINYFFNEFLPEYEHMKNTNTTVETKATRGEVPAPEVPTTPAPNDSEEADTLAIRIKKQFDCPTDLAVVYALLMSNFTVKLGMTKDLTDRIKQIQADTKLDTLDFASTPFMARDDAAALEQYLLDKFSAYSLGGEFFDVRFLSVKAALAE